MPPEASTLAGPAVVTIKVGSTRGPFSRKGASVALPPTQIRIVNTGSAPLTIAPLMFDPLQWSDTGAAADASLTANVAQRELQPGESSLLTISGRVPAAPAAYASTLRVASQEGAHLPVRIEFRVAAAAAWGFGCMVLGLLLVGLLSLLDGASGVRGDLRHALIERQAAHEFLQKTPPPQSLMPLVTSLDREYDAAIEILQQPRAFSFVDRRGADAKEHLDRAQTINGELRQAMAAKPRGGIEIADLVEEWTALAKHFEQISRQFLGPAPQGMALAQRLGAFDAWAAQRLLKPPLETYTRDFDYQVSRVLLTHASGRTPIAAAEAVAVRRWMQRAADVVNAQVQLASYYAQLSQSNVATAERTRRRIATAGTSPDRRAAVLSMLDDAAATLTEPFDWPMRRTVNERILAARTETLRAETDTVLAAALAARAQEEKDDSLAAIEAVIAEGSKLKRGADNKVDPADKARWLRRNVAAWRARLATFADPEPAAMRAELDRLEVAVESGDMDAVAMRSRSMFEQWSAYSSARAQAMILKATAPFCLRLRDDALVDLQASQASMRRLESHPKLQPWEGQLDQLAMKVRASPDAVENMPPNCLATLTELSTQAYNLSNEIDSALWDATVLPDATKRQLAIDLRGSLTPETLRNLLADVRPLQIEVSTPPEERYVGREIEFRIANLDPIWGPGVMVSLNFGDDQFASASAEDLRKKAWFTHVYAAAKGVKPVAAAAEGFRPNSLDAIGKQLGQGEMKQFYVLPSPISLARQFADRFFNARFGLALLVAGLLYFWRYHATKTVFGANRFDYVQAFALGFVVSLAVDQFPQKFSDFIK